MENRLKYMTILLNNKVVKRPKVKSISHMHKTIAAAAKAYGHGIRAIVKDANGDRFMDLSYREDKGGVHYLVNKA